MRLTSVGDHFGTHIASSMVTGLVTTTATAPVDVIKTHMFVGMLCVLSYTVNLVLLAFTRGALLCNLCLLGASPSQWWMA